MKARKKRVVLLNSVPREEAERRERERQEQAAGAGATRLPLQPPRPLRRRANCRRQHRRLQPAFVPRIVSTGRVNPRPQPKAPPPPQREGSPAAAAAAAAQPQPQARSSRASHAARRTTAQPRVPAAPGARGADPLRASGVACRWRCQLALQEEKAPAARSRSSSPGAEGRHAFEMPTAPVVREVSRSARPSLWPSSRRRWPSRPTKSSRC